MSSGEIGAARAEENAKRSSQIPEDLFFRNIVASYVEAPRFVRRDWLAQDLQVLLAETGCRFVLLTGEPGVGKSAFIAQVAATNHDWPVYFIRKDQRRSLGDGGAKTFLLRIGFEIAALFPEAFDPEQIRVDVEQEIGTAGSGAEVVGARIAKIRTSPFQQTAVRITQRVQQNQGRLVGLEVDEWLADPRLLDTEDLHEMALFRPARNLLRLQPKLRIVIVVDALDELRYQTIDNDILSWLTRCPPLPENIRFVLTSRPEQDALRIFTDKQGDSVRTLKLDATDPRVRNELTQYAAGLAAVPEVSTALARTGRTPEEFAEQCALKADGNIGYLATLARAVDQQRGRPEGEALLDELVALKQLPSDLDGLYAFFLGQIMSRQAERDITVTDPLTHRRGLLNAWTDLYQPIVSVLAVALQPLTIDQLQALSGTLASREQVSQAVEWLSQFLDQIGTEYRLFHTTLAEFLTSDKTRMNAQWSALYVNAEHQHRAIATELARDDGAAIWRDDSHPAVQGRRSYARSFYISHLYLGHDWDRLFRVIEDGAFGKGKLKSDPGMFAYASDLDMAIEAAEAIPALGTLWRYKLLRSTMAGYADALPPASYAALVAVGRAGEALRLVELVVDPARQVAAFAELAKSLPADPAAQRCLFRGFDVLALLASEERGRVADGLLKAAWEVRNASGALSPEIQQSLEKAGVQMVQEPGGGDFARSAALLLFSVGADDKVQALLDAMWNGCADQVCGLLVEFGQIDEARRAAAMIPQPAGLVASLGAIAIELMKAGHEEAALSTLAECWEHIDKEDDPDSKSEMLMIIGDSAVAVGDRKEAASAFQQAFELITRGQHDAKQVERLARALKEAGDPDGALRAFRFVQEMALKQVSDRKPGSGESFTLSLDAIDAGILAGDLDQIDAALAIAGRLAAWEQYAVIGSAIRAMARSDDLDRAIKTTEVFAQLKAASLASILMTRSEEDPVDEANALALIAEKFADRGDWPRAVELADRIGSGYERCRAQSRIALRQLEAGLRSQAANLVDRQMREVRLRNTSDGKKDGLSAAVDIFIDGGRLREAKEAAASIPEGWTRSSAMQRIGNALVDAAEFEAAENLAKELPASNCAMVLVAIARKHAGSGSDSAAATLERAWQVARSIEEGGARSSALRDICLVYRDLPGHDKEVHGVMFEAVEGLQKADRFPYRPTPWGDMFLLMAKVGEWQTLQGWVKQLVDFDPFDGCSALLKIAEYAWQSGQQERLGDLLAKAIEAAARVTFPPLQSQCYADLARLYAKMGRFEEAAQAKEIIEPANRASDMAMRYIAEELAKIGRIDEAYEAIKSSKSASSDLVDAIVHSGNPESALEYVRTFSESSDKADGLARVASGFAAAGDRNRAVALLKEAAGLPPGNNPGTLLSDIAKRYIAMDERRLATAMVAGEWRRAPSRWELTRRLEAARPLGADFPALGDDVSRGFRWVEDFLGA